MMENQEANLFASNELLGAVLSDVCCEDSDVADKVGRDIKGFMLSNFNIDFEGVDLHIVRNSADEVHLILPEYDSFEVIRAEMLEDSRFEEVSGGFEILFSIIGLFAAIGTSLGVGVAAGTATVVATAASVGTVAAVGAAAAATAPALAVGVGVTVGTAVGVGGAVVGASAAVGATSK